MALRFKPFVLDYCSNGCGRPRFYSDGTCGADCPAIAPKTWERELRIRGHIARIQSHPEFFSEGHQKPDLIEHSAG